MPRTFVWHRTRGPKVTPKEEAPTSGKVNSVIRLLHVPLSQ